MICKRTLRRAVWLGGGIVTLAVVSGCISEPPPRAAPPQAPAPDTNVYFYPAKGQSPEQQDRDKYECHTWAVQQSGFDPNSASTPPHLRVQVAAGGAPPGTGVAAGAVTGAVVGAAVSRPWEAGQGALLGAMAGAVIGGVAENAAAEQARAQAATNANDARATLLESQARNYRRAMTACLEARGYNVR
jgi:Glycine zipper 2TM domain